MSNTSDFVDIVLADIAVPHLAPTSTIGWLREKRLDHKQTNKIV